ncbi:MAG: glutathione S-transferase N-terminal domain-containing protein [Gammaproteobacteria bacterium]|nr:glutathione S-transferase N-terminal domain-containing protein [Gammaproteobacteria bacterium]
MKLYGSLTSPYVRKLRVLVQEKDIACEFVVENPHDADSSIPHLNPLGKVPVLLLDNDEVLFESTLLVEYLDGLAGAPLMPANGPARLQALRWHALGQGMLDATVARLMEMRRPAEKQLPEAIARQEKKIARALRFAEAAAGDGAYLVENRFGVADIALGVALEYLDFRYPHDWRASYPRLAQWLAGIGARPSFLATRPPGMETAAAPR